MRPDGPASRPAAVWLRLASGAVKATSTARVPSVALRRVRRAWSPRDSPIWSVGRTNETRSIVVCSSDQTTFRDRETPCPSAATTATGLLAGSRPRGRRRAVDAADPARRVPRRTPVLRLPGPPRHLQAVLSARLDALVADGLLERSGAGIRSTRSPTRPWGCGRPSSPSPSGASAGRRPARRVGSSAHVGCGDLDARRPLLDLRGHPVTRRPRDPARARRRPDAARRPGRPCRSASRTGC